MSASSPLKVDFSELNEWLPYTIDSRTIFGSFSHVKEAQKITLCFSTLKGCPVVVIFDAKDIKKQAAGQGIVVESDITEQVAHLLREPSKALQIHIDENQVVLEITISRDIKMCIRDSTHRLDDKCHFCSNTAVSSDGNFTERLYILIRTATSRLGDLPKYLA